MWTISPWPTLTARWTNYYIEGLNWLAKNQRIDGLYLDDIAFSMADVERLIRVLHRLVGAGNSLLVIEHNLDLIAEAD